ncbi:MAG: hypothetical protein PVI86_09665 [Phycisphaerae bacterium]|jgi:hypothetical protein
MTLEAKVAITVTSTLLVLAWTPPVVAQGTCECGPGPGWVDNCPAGMDDMPQTGAEVGIDTNDDGDPEISLVLGGPVTIGRNAGSGGVIATWIESMSLTGSGITLTAGKDEGLDAMLLASSGIIVEQSPGSEEADSTFEVMFEVALGGGTFAYNHTPLLVQAKIDCVPPTTGYIHPQGQVVPLYAEAPPAAPLTWVANLVDAVHWTFPYCGDEHVNQPWEECDLSDEGACPNQCFPPDKPNECTCSDVSGPALPVWGLVGVGVLLFGGGAMIFRRKRAARG